MTETAHPDWTQDTCKSCDAQVIWAETTQGNRMPVNVAYDTTDGNLVLVHRGPGMPPLARVLSMAQRFGRTTLRTSHFATCQQAKRWRRRT